MDSFLLILLLLVAAHFLCDVALQPAWLSSAKRGLDPDVPWWGALGAHGLIHGGAVAAITGIWWLGLAEAAAHAALDGAKVRGWIGAEADQLLHLGCKALWALIAIGGVA